GDLMQRQIVHARTEVDIVRIRFPHHLHAKELFVKCPRASQIRHSQRHMSEPQMERTTHRFLSSSYSRWPRRPPSISISPRGRGLRVDSWICYDDGASFEQRSRFMRMSVMPVAVIGVILLSPWGLLGAGSSLSGKDGAPMVLIPAGSFPMGVPPGERDGGR